jgi:nucleoside-diphosphate-sugar epimerase
MKRIVVFGSSGFVGKSLLEKLIGKKFNVIVSKNKTKIEDNVKVFDGNLLDHDSFESKIKDNDVIINLAGQFKGNFSNFIDLNIKGGLNLLEVCKKKKGIRIILISSVNVYGESDGKASKENQETKPGNMYGTIKVLTENLYETYSKNFGIKITILRLANLYGVNKKNGLVINMINSLEKNKIVTINHLGNQERDYLYIDDAIDGIIKTIQNPQKDFQIFNITSGRGVKTNTVIKIIEKLCDKKIRKKIVKESPDEKSIYADNKKAKKILSFAPKISLKEGIKIILEKSK